MHHREVEVLKWCPATSGRFPNETFIACMHDILQLGTLTSPMRFIAAVLGGSLLHSRCGCSGGKGAASTLWV